MEWKETVTFGGSGLDRAAELRADTQAIEALAREEGTRFIVFWKGKPALFADASRPIAHAPKSWLSASLATGYPLHTPA